MTVKHWLKYVDPADTSSQARSWGKLGELVGVRVLDHLVIGRGRSMSFVDDGYW